MARGLSTSKCQHGSPPRQVCDVLILAVGNGIASLHKILVRLGMGLCELEITCQRSLMKCRITLTAFVFVVPAIVAADWLQFRGPGGLGVAADKNLPTTWSDKENIVWKTDLPGPGSSSPIVVGDKIFVTCYNDYGVVQDDMGDA